MKRGEERRAEEKKRNQSRAEQNRSGASCRDHLWRAQSKVEDDKLLPTYVPLGNDECLHDVDISITKSPPSHSSAAVY